MNNALTFEQAVMVAAVMVVAIAVILNEIRSGE